MEYKLIIALLFAGLLAFSMASDDDSNGSDSGSESGGSAEASFEKQDEDCDRLVEGSDENDGNCDFTDGIDQAADECDCSDEDKAQIKNFTKTLRIKLSVKVSVEQRLIIALTELQKFQIEFPTVYENIQFMNISGWGYLASYVKVIQFRQMSWIDKLLTLDEDNNCPLFDALLNNTDGSYDQEAACNALINETLIDICGDSSLSSKKKMVLIYKAFSQFFSINAEWQFTFFQFNIEGFGSFQQFFECTRTQYQSSEIDTVLEGEVSETKFFVSFKAQLTIILADTTISSSMKSIIKQFYDDLLEECGTKTTGKARLTLIIKKFRSLFKLYSPSSKEYQLLIKILYGIQIDGFGSFFEVISCGPIRNPPPKPPTVIVPVSTKKPTCSCTCASSTTLSV